MQNIPIHSFCSRRQMFFVYKLLHFLCIRLNWNILVNGCYDFTRDAPDMKVRNQIFSTPQTHNWIKAKANCWFYYVCDRVCACATLVIHFFDKFTAKNPQRHARDFRASHSKAVQRCVFLPNQICTENYPRNQNINVGCDIASFSCFFIQKGFFIKKKNHSNSISMQISIKKTAIINKQPTYASFHSK